jgi:hypothetical protein
VVQTPGDFNVNIHPEDFLVVHGLNQSHQWIIITLFVLFGAV